MLSRLFPNNPEDATIDAARASLPAITLGTARADQLVTWLTNHAQAYARAVDADHRANALHYREQMNSVAEEILFRMTRMNSGRAVA
jgi:hypothetical protein